MGGLLAWKNLVNFQTEFAGIRAENPGLAEGVVAELAGKAISFGQARIRIGYGDIRVRYGNMGDVTLPNGTVLDNVPQVGRDPGRPHHAGPLRPAHHGALPTAPGAEIAPTSVWGHSTGE